MQVKNELWTVEDFTAKKDQIEGQPLYQRGVDWNISKRQLLLDSILRKLDIPKIYLNKLANNPIYQYQIIDGQQRLNSIWKFACDQDLTLDLPKDLSKTSWNKCSYNTLNKKDKKHFNEFPIAVGIVQTATEDEVRDLFARLQMGERLNPAELRNSIRSTLGVEIRHVAENHKFFRNCRFSVKRFKHHDLAAHAFALEINKMNEDLKAQNLRNMYIYLKDDSCLKYSRRVAQVLNYLHSVQKAIPGWIDRKWSFVDLYLVVSQTARNKLPNPAIFGDNFKRFEQKRRQNLDRPQRLLNSPKRDKDMYEYIQAFQLSGGVSDNVVKRNKILRKRVLLP